jgi:hypothetical protein
MNPYQSPQHCEETRWWITALECLLRFLLGFVYFPLLVMVALVSETRVGHHAISAGVAVCVGFMVSAYWMALVVAGLKSALVWVVNL